MTNCVLVVEIFIVLSFIPFLSFSAWLAGKILRASILGPLVIGMVYGEPLSNILKQEWQETFLALGYIGLILIIFEGPPMVKRRGSPLLNTPRQEV